MPRAKFIPLDLDKIALFTLGAALFSGLAACSDSPEGQPQERVSRDGTRVDDPPGAALPLSIGGRVDEGAGDEVSAAIHCAAALGLTAQRLASVTDNPLSNEIALIGRAEEFFIQRAEKAASEAETAVGSVEAAVARRREEKSAETTEQAQLAIACLRRFGDNVDPVTGEPL